MTRRPLRPSERTTVLLFTNSVTMGGMEEHVRLLAAHLDRRAYAVIGVAPSDANVRGLAVALAAECDAFEEVTPDRRWGARQAAVEALRLAGVVRRYRVDVAHLHSTTYGGLWIACLMCWLGGTRRVFVTEHLAPYGGASRWRRVERWAFRAVITGLVCVSEKNQAARAAMFAMPRSTTVVTNGIEVDRMSGFPLAEIARVRAEHGLDGHIVVGTAVRLEPEKGVDDLVRAFADVVAGHPGTRLLIVGDGSRRSELARLAEDLGIGDATIFAGFQADPRPFLGAMDIFVLPVPAGSASIGLLEAMAMGLPAVISFGGPGEAVEPGINGWWAVPHDLSSLAEHITQLVADGDRRAEMGKAARQRIERDFSAERVAARLGALYVSPDATLVE